MPSQDSVQETASKIQAETTKLLKQKEKANAAERKVFSLKADSGPDDASFLDFILDLEKCLVHLAPHQEQEIKQYKWLSIVGQLCGTVQLQIGGKMKDFSKFSMVRKVQKAEVHRCVRASDPDFVDGEIVVSSSAASGLTDSQAGDLANELLGTAEHMGQFFTTNRLDGRVVEWPIVGELLNNSMLGILTASNSNGGKFDSRKAAAHELSAAVITQVMLKIPADFDRVLEDFESNKKDLLGCSSVPNAVKNFESMSISSIMLFRIRLSLTLHLQSMLGLQCGSYLEGPNAIQGTYLPTIMKQQVDDLLKICEPKSPVASAESLALKSLFEIYKRSKMTFAVFFRVIGDVMWGNFEFCMNNKPETYEGQRLLMATSLNSVKSADIGPLLATYGMGDAKVRGLASTYHHNPPGGGLPGPRTPGGGVDRLGGERGRGGVSGV